METISDLSRKLTYLSSYVYVSDKDKVLLKFQQRDHDAFIKRKTSI